MLKNKQIIIIEGRDRLGKSTIIKKLVQSLEDRNIIVSVLGDKDVQPSTNVSINTSQFSFSNMKLNNEMFQEFRGASYTAMSFFIRRLFEVTGDKHHVIIFDRLQLSTFVYGTMLRQQLFNKIHGSIEQYITYMNAFEAHLQDIADTHLFTFITSHITDADDDEHSQVSIKANHINMSNKLFAYIHSESAIRQSVCINVQYDEAAQLYDTINHVDALIDVTSL